MSETKPALKQIGTETVYDENDVAREVPLYECPVGVSLNDAAKRLGGVALGRRDNGRVDAVIAERGRGAAKARVRIG